LGGDKNTSVRINRSTIAPQHATLGDAVRLSFEIESTASKARRLPVDYAVHFVKANGGTRPDVFKLRSFTLQPGEKVAFSATVSLVPMKTRRLLPGHHRNDVLINGEAHPIGDFLCRTPDLEEPYRR
jgi:hypothetical protein